MSGDLLELLFVAAFILFGLLGGRKKKRPPAPVARPRRPPAARPGATEQDRLLRELEGLLTGKPVPPEPAPVPPGNVPDPDEARSLEGFEVDVASTWDEAKERTADVSDGWRAGRARAAETLETLEGAGGKSHQRFHVLYDRPPETPAPQRTRPMFPAADMRRAIVWSEILAPPVSEREP